MDCYYLYLLSGDGRIKDREILNALDESDAVSKAQAYLHHHTSVPGVELWLGGLKIIVLEQTAAA